MTVGLYSDNNAASSSENGRAISQRDLRRQRDRVVSKQVAASARISRAFAFVLSLKLAVAKADLIVYLFDDQGKEQERQRAYVWRCR